MVPSAPPAREPLSFRLLGLGLAPRFFPGRIRAGHTAESEAAATHVRHALVDVGPDVAVFPCAIETRDGFAVNVEDLCFYIPCHAALRVDAYREKLDRIKRTFRKRSEISFPAEVGVFAGFAALIPPVHGLLQGNSAKQLIRLPPDLLCKFLDGIGLRDPSRRQFCAVVLAAFVPFDLRDVTPGKEGTAQSGLFIKDHEHGHGSLLADIDAVFDDMAVEDHDAFLAGSLSVLDTRPGRPTDIFVPEALVVGADHDAGTLVDLLGHADGRFPRGLDADGVIDRVDGSIAYAHVSDIRARGPAHLDRLTCVIGAAG